MPKVLGGVAVHVWLQQRPLTLSLSRQVAWSELHLESVLRQPCGSVILGYSGTVVEERNWKNWSKSQCRRDWPDSRDSSK